MKEGWEIIPFEKSIQKVKYTTKVPSSDYLPVGAFPIVSQEEGLISGYWDNEADVFHHNKPVVIFGDHTRIIKYVDFDFVLGADGVKILLPVDNLSAKFLSYYLRWYKVPSLGYSRHFKLLKEASIPVPPLHQQEKIVAELDCLSEVVLKKKQQMEELDKLAQSIFYDMFGDPITNEKGLEVRQMGTFCRCELGKMLDVKKNRGRLLPYLCSINVQWGRFDLSYLKEMRFEDDELERFAVKKGDLMICEGGDAGRCAIWNEDYSVFYQKALHRVRFNESVMLPIVCQFIMKIYKDRGEMDKYCKGQTIKHLVKEILITLPMITPPLDLQNDFAQKIEAIEKQKELVKRSIVETETLFNSRMDFWFNN